MAMLKEHARFGVLRPRAALEDLPFTVQIGLPPCLYVVNHLRTSYIKTCACMCMQVAAHKTLKVQQLPSAHKLWPFLWIPCTASELRTLKYHTSLYHRQ